MNAVGLALGPPLARIFAPRSLALFWAEFFEMPRTTPTTSTRRSWPTAVQRQPHGVQRLQLRPERREHQRDAGQRAGLSIANGRGWRGAVYWASPAELERLGDAARGGHHADGGSIGRRDVAGRELLGRGPGLGTERRRPHRLGCIPSPSVGRTRAAREHPWRRSPRRPGRRRPARCARLQTPEASSRKQTPAIGAGRRAAPRAFARPSRRPAPGRRGDPERARGAGAIGWRQIEHGLVARLARDAEGVDALGGRADARAGVVRVFGRR